MTDVGSITSWLDQFRVGNDLAGHHLWERYFLRLQGLARKKLPTGLKGADEDVALNAFVSLWRGLARGSFPELASRENLWRLLVVITMRKVYHLMRDEGRGVARHSQDWVLEQVLSREPGPEFETQAEEEYDRLMSILSDPRLTLIARLRIEGQSVKEIAAHLQCSPRTVDRKLLLIQAIWAEEIES